MDFDAEDGEQRVYSTRSKVNISDAAMEDLEQLFVPPDITPDMYDVPTENVDYEYLEFLLGCQSDKASGAAPDEPEVDDDPEYLYCPDEADQETKDPEELRNDKATKITKKEVEDLMSELKEFANKNCDDENNKKQLIKRKKTLPGDEIFEAVKEHTERASKETKDQDTFVNNTADSSELVMSEQERTELSLQFQQHIQLLTQMSLLSSHNSDWAGVRSQCDSMMSDLLKQSLVCHNSVAGQPNLITSMAVIKEWDRVGSNPTVISKNKNSAKHKKRYRYFHISRQLQEFMANQSVFYYPLLLPLNGLNQDQLRIIWTESEDNLLAFAMKESVAKTKKPGLVELSYTLQKRYMKPKSAIQILSRIKNLGFRFRDGDNPVLQFIKNGKFHPRELKHTWSEVGNGSKSMLEMFVSGSRKDFSQFWHNSLTQTILGLKNKTVVPIAPKPKPSLPSSSLLVSCAVESQSFKSPNINQVPILCVDGNNTTPVSDTEAPDVVPTHSESVRKSPIKKLIITSGQFSKSPLKAASDRIIKKYSVISPHKRTGSAILKSPQKKAFKKKVFNISPKPVTPSRRLSLNVVHTPPGVDINYSPKSPCLPSPNLDDGEGINEVDTPTHIGKRKSRHQKEAELTLALVGSLESAEEKEAREARESTEIFQEIMKVVSDNSEKKLKFAEIMSRASTEGPVHTFKDLHHLMDGYAQVQEMLLDLLSESEAAGVSREVYWLHHQRQNMKKFILKLNVAYRQQPAYHARVLRELDNLCSDTSLTTEMVRAVAVKLFKHNQHLLDHFMMLVPGVEPPESMLPSPEMVNFHDTDSDNSGPSSETETVVLHASPEYAK